MGGDLGGKAAIVTGGANGIGREIAPVLLQPGAEFGGIGEKGRLGHHLGNCLGKWGISVP